MHEVVTRIYQPNTYDENSGLGANFGTTIMIINGAEECNRPDGLEVDAAEVRGSYYSSFLDYFGLPAE